MKNFRLYAFLVILILHFNSIGIFARDILFYAWSDTHFGACNNQNRLDVISQMNKLPTMQYPEYYATGESIGMPAFLINLGDITESGTAIQWNDMNAPNFASYLQTIKNLMPGCPTYETIGNHDSKKNNVVRQMVAEKFGKTYYSFDVNDVHFVILDPYTAGLVAAPDLDANQLDWLEKDLAKLSSNAYIIIAMHIQPDANANTDRSSKLGEESSAKLAAILKNKNVLAIMHGHWHRLNKAVWNGIDVVSPAGYVYGIPGCSCADRHCSQVWGMIHITDTTITSLAYNWEFDRWETEKEIVLKKSLPEKN
jgi:3',5'-cyclic AMP phosphodiesterase CpdA